MALTKKTEPRKTDAGISFDTYESGKKVVHVEVTEEAIEDFCDPRGLKFDVDNLPAPLLEAILLAAEKLVDRSPADMTSVRVDTKTLNG
ncbi:hypothetical protein GOD90_27115 [Sinorhizobium medicae]|nr:hypothetical protein [Sinorhizobium medicae]MDX0716506.1 hypothetical protein [Sinorhizobium medicae]MDX0846208.1 hypothetical protein [Sinorhizobium medicae]MDX0900602.1 hypothetical protein [Sinorhizobium medicae]